MNTSQFMDKQIMDLASQGSIPSKDFIDLANHPEEDLDRTAATAGGGGGGGGGSGRNGNIDEDDGVKREEILPSYDFQPIRPIAVSDMPSLGFDGGSARAWGSADSKANASTPVRSYSSFDTFEPAKVIVEKDKNAFDATILSEIDRTMKKHADNLLHALEGVSARLTQLESKTHNLENSVDDLKASVGNNYGSADGKMRHLENILREVQAGVQVLKDKQEIIEAQYQLAKLQVPMAGQQQDTQKTSHVGSVQSISSVPPQPPQQTPASFQQSLPALPTSNAPPHPLPHQNLPPPVQLPSQFPQTQVPPGPQRESYFPPPAQAQETSNQQYQVPPLQQPPAPPGPTHQQYQTVPPPQFSQPPPPPPQHTSVAPANPPQQPLGRHPEDNTYIPPQTYPPSLHQPPAQPLSGPPPSQQFYGTTPQMYEPPSSRPSSGFSAPYGHPSGPSEMQYGGSQYGTSPPMKSQQHSQSGGVGYPQLPTARVLPHALPTASAVSSGSGSGGTGNRVPIDDVVDKVTSMGFPREHVRATVQRLTENGQPVDLNIVLDKLMNDSDIQPPRGWFGR